MTEPSYLGDGLYASHDGHQFWLAANHPESQLRVALEPAVLEAFLRYVETTLGCTITVTFPTSPKEQ